MQFLLLICLMMACLPVDWPAPPERLGLRGSVACTGLLVCFLLLVAFAIARYSVSRMNRHPESRDAVASRYGSARTWFFFANLGAFAVSLLVFGWGWSANQLCTFPIRGRVTLAPGGELLLLAPFFLVQIGSWFFFYDVDRQFVLSSSSPERTQRFWSRGGYVLFLTRQQLVLVFVPLFLLMGQQGIERLYPEAFRSDWVALISVLTLPAFLLIFPLLLPALLGLRPLPPGPLRDRLSANARRLHFRYTQIYLWDTRGGIANAMIVGIIPWLRFVIFTDRLLDDLRDDEVDAVLGHEIGHARHGHIIYYALFLTLSFVVLGALIQSLRLIDDSFWREHRTLLMIGPVAVMGAYMFSAFGFLSRRCERQADLFGCRAVSCADDHCDGHDFLTEYPEYGRGLCRTGIEAFIRGLQRVEEVNGMSRPKMGWRGVGIRGKVSWIFNLLTGWLHTWQHSTIPKRIAYLQRVAADRRVEERFQRRLWRLRWAIMIALVGVLAALIRWRGWDAVMLRF
jgi:STE24 endopeptidase